HYTHFSDLKSELTRKLYLPLLVLCIRTSTSHSVGSVLATFISPVIYDWTYISSGQH
ncbi:12828_t:CDS:1, partial [Funneliformis mosseae]